MNANELAEFWELVAQNCQEKGWFATDNGKNGMLITATMLRQQQAKIGALKDDKLKYAEAVVEALEWGSYAGDYSKWNDIVSKLRKAQE